MASWRHQQGLSLLEFTLAVLIVAVFTLLAFDRISGVSADMERARVQHTVAAMRSALALRFADLAVNDRFDELTRHEGVNALELLAPPPTNYLGERKEAVANVEAGSWYYVRGSEIIAYRPRYPFAFDGVDERLYWRVVVRRNNDGRGGYDGAGGQGLALTRSTVAGVPLPAQGERIENAQ